MAMDAKLPPFADCWHTMFALGPKQDLPADYILVCIATANVDFAY